MSDAFQSGNACEIYHDTQAQAAPIIEGLIYPGLTNLCGKQKDGKSILATQMALAVAAGVEFLSTFPVLQGSVLYLQYEGSRAHTRSLLRRMLPNQNPPASLVLNYLWKTAGQGGVEEMAAYTETFSDTKLVIVDTAPKFVGRGNGQTYAKEYGCAGELHELGIEQNVAIVFLHHTVKQPKNGIDDVRGFGGFTGVADTTMLLVADKERYRGHLNAISRHGSSEHHLRFNKQRMLYEYLGAGDSRVLTPECEEMLEVVIQFNGPARVRDIAKQADRKIPAASKLLRKLLNLGLLVNPKYGTYEVSEAGERALEVAKR